MNIACLVVQNILTTFAYPAMQNMEIRDFNRINVVRLNIEPGNKAKHVLVMEVFGDEVMRYYLAELPVIPVIMRKRLRYYENIVN